MPSPVIDKPFILIHFHSSYTQEQHKSTPLAEVYRLESFIPRIHSLTRQATEEDQTLYFAFPLPLSLTQLQQMIKGSTWVSSSVPISA